jgi:small subunit ribosomal protein S16
MLTLKLSRTGKRTQPHFKLIVIEKGRDPWGEYHELLGNYNPITKKAEFKIDRINHYISNGAQLTDSVNNLLIKLDIIKGKKRAVTNLSTKRRKTMSDALAKQAAAAEAKAAKEAAEKEAAAAKAVADKEAAEKAAADAKAAAEAAAAAPAPEATPEVAPEAPAEAQA